MLRHPTLILCITLTAFLAATSQADTNGDPSSSAGSAGKVNLELRHVTLFSSGVGFFERQATIDGSASVDLQFRTEQINDILKSLIVQDFDGGSVDVVTYTPKDPLERTLQSFGVKLTGKETLAQLLDSLRGQRVRIAAPREMTGTILGVETCKMIVGENVVESDVLSLLGETGMLQLPLAELRGVQLLDEKVNSELHKALAALASSQDAAKKSVVLEFSGQGQRRVAASFLLEAPIWKTSYRLVLADEGRPFLQGWAIVENTTDEDWKDVSLSLVSGRPISFVMDLYTPIYLKRPLEDLELYASLRAPQFEAGDALSLSPSAKARVQEELAAPASTTAGRTVLARRARGVDKREAGSYFFADSRLAGTGVKSVAEAQEAGELFEYVIETPVSIARQQSAMLPIVNAEITGEKLSIFNPQNHAKYPLNGLKLTNSTDLNLMQGPVTLFDGGTYAGDAKLPDLKPGEDRLVAYALDLGTEVMTESKSHPTQIVSLTIRKGTLVRRNKGVDQREYKIRNKQSRDKTVIIEQAASSDWKLVEPTEPFERTENLMRFKVSAPAGKTVTQKVHTERIYSETVVLSELDLKTIQYYITNLGGEVVSPRVREAMEKIVAMRTELDRIGRQRAAAEQTLEEAGEEQERIRKNLQVLQHNTDSYSRQLDKLDRLETQIENTREQVTELRKQEQRQRTDLERYLAELTVDGN